MNDIPWNLIRSFLTTAHEGSLSAAARVLGVSQPTLTRDIQALEAHTKLNLFKRSTQGLTLTEMGKALVESAEKMADFSDSFHRQASGLHTELNGDIRISVNEIMGIYVLPAAIAAFKERYPAVNIEIVVSNKSSSLNKREADIALRMFEPTQAELIARRLQDIPLGFFAHHDYLEKHGEPQTFNELKDHRIIGTDQNMEFIHAAKAMGYTFTPDDFHLRTDNLLLQIQLAHQACGILVTHVGLAQHSPKLVRILEWVPIPTLQFWIVCHADSQHNACIRTFKNHLIQWFKDDVYHGFQPQGDT